MGGMGRLQGGYQMKNRQNTKRLPALLSAFLAAVMMIGVLPAQAFAVSQAEIDESMSSKSSRRASWNRKRRSTTATNIFWNS